MSDGGNLCPGCVCRARVWSNICITSQCLGRGTARSVPVQRSVGSKQLLTALQGYCTTAVSALGIYNYTSFGASQRTFVSVPETQIYDLWFSPEIERQRNKKTSPHFSTLPCILISDQLTLILKSFICFVTFCKNLQNKLGTYQNINSCSTDVNE